MGIYQEFTSFPDSLKLSRVLQMCAFTVFEGLKELHFLHLFCCATKLYLMNSQHALSISTKSRPIKLANNNIFQINVIILCNCFIKTKLLSNWHNRIVKIGESTLELINPPNSLVYKHFLNLESFENVHSI